MRNVLGFAVLLGLAACGDGGPANDGQSEARTSPAPIDPGVYDPYTRENGFNKTIDKWGSVGVSRIQRLRESAAATVAANPKCDAVEISELSDNRSNAPNAPVVFVDCRNGERFYLSEADVGSSVSSEIEKGSRYSSADLIQRCTEAVRERLNIPASFDRNYFSISERQGTSGNRVVEFDFKAQNRLGLSLPAQARCIMTTRGEFEVTVIE